MRGFYCPPLLFAITHPRRRRRSGNARHHAISIPRPPPRTSISMSKSKSTTETQSGRRSRSRCRTHSSVRPRVSMSVLAGSRRGFGASVTRLGFPSCDDAQVEQRVRLEELRSLRYCESHGKHPIPNATRKQAKKEEEKKLDLPPTPVPPPFTYSPTNSSQCASLPPNAV